MEKFYEYNFPIYKQDGYRFVTEDHPYLFLTLIFTLVVFSFEILLDFRQLGNFAIYITITISQLLLFNINTFICINIYLS
jgi:hypothetical protein